jgi:hypothetical protein
MVAADLTVTSAYLVKSPFPSQFRDACDETAWDRDA